MHVRRDCAFGFFRKRPVASTHDTLHIALLLAVLLCWLDRCFNSLGLLGLLCLIRVTRCSGLHSWALGIHIAMHHIHYMPEHLLLVAN